MLPHNPAIPPTRLYKENEDLGPQKPVHVYSSFIHKIPKLETPQHTSTRGELTCSTPTRDRSTAKRNATRQATRMPPQAASLRAACRAHAAGLYHDFLYQFPADGHLCCFQFFGYYKGSCCEHYSTSLCVDIHLYFSWVNV